MVIVEKLIEVSHIINANRICSYINLRIKKKLNILCNNNVLQKVKNLILFYFKYK